MKEEGSDEEDKESNDLSTDHDFKPIEEEEEGSVHTAKKSISKKVTDHGLTSGAEDGGVKTDRLGGYGTNKDESAE